MVVSSLVEAGVDAGEQREAAREVVKLMGSSAGRRRWGVRAGVPRPAVIQFCL